MAAAPVLEALAPRDDDEVLAALSDCRVLLSRLAAHDVPVPDGERIDRIAALEELRSVVAAAQSAELVRFARSQVAARLEAAEREATEFELEAAQRGIADQLGLACRVSPYEAAQRLTAARTWIQDLPQTFTALSAGRLHERVARDVVAATWQLDPVQRRDVDQAVADSHVERLGVRAAKAKIDRLAYEADKVAWVGRGRRERQDRRVSLRAAPDTMSFLTGYLPVEQGVACLAALRRSADEARARGDDRTRGQVMADTLVERVTGRQRATDVDVELQILVPLNALARTGPTLSDGDDSVDGAAALQPSPPSDAVQISGYGWLPRPLARELLSTTEGQVFWRRLFTAPTESGGETIVGGDPRRRLFDRHVRRLVLARDQTCRMPYCDAAIREVDHATGWASGGDTALDNAQGLCQRHNLVKEEPGWRMTLPTPDITVVETPAGRHYAARAPDPP